MKEKEKRTVRHVFWTGGLDSTYRVIDLLRTSEELVKPHYIIRHEESTGNEIDAMNNIRRGVTRKYPDLRPKLLPTTYINEDLIPHVEEVDVVVDKLRAEMRGVHEQYQILAHYCKSSKIEEIDLTYEREQGEPSPDNIGVSQYFGKTYPFDNFRNPHANITKKECYIKAKAEDWHDLLKLTSFCRRPKRNGKPCGTCGPCADVVKEGLGFRLPLSSRIKARILLPFRNYYRNNADKHDSHWFFKAVRKRFEHRF